MWAGLLRRNTGGPEGVRPTRDLTSLLAVFYLTGSSCRHWSEHSDRKRLAARRPTATLPPGRVLPTLAVRQASDALLE